MSDHVDDSHQGAACNVTELNPADGKKKPNVTKSQFKYIVDACLTSYCHHIRIRIPDLSQMYLFD